ncbi:hypothetical protein GGR06_004212 [Bacteroides reticulotermitis]|uniref:Uncharacterized protein n=1 Tax=Bacteroides reticulotermitis TaxID=1133319 RepID=A0A840D7C5_9BACE|nr:hypothetical protein [Bacteroides reticulotermitis]
MNIEGILMVLFIFNCIGHIGIIFTLAAIYCKLHNIDKDR